LTTAVQSKQNIQSRCSTSRRAPFFSTDFGYFTIHYLHNAYMSAIGGINVLSVSLHSMEKIAEIDIRQYGKSLKYIKLGSSNGWDWIITLRNLNSSALSYHKTWVNKNMIEGIRVVFPVSELHRYEPIIQRIQSSFRPFDYMAHKSR
ncbi:MAG: hypothetical protein ACYCVB_17255, partial [Bacilli bacterium]